MYKKVTTDLNFVEREKEVEKFWADNKIFEKSMKLREGQDAYVFYDGPPTANGKPHIGHVLTRVIKDMIPRYHNMKGQYVPRKAGWDTHGLPVELEVERQIGIDGKEQIEEYGLEPFIAKCKESVWQYKGMWEDFSSTVGFWADMEDPYVTYHDDYIESEWWALKKIWERGLLNKGYKVVPYCPRCGTPLSSHEVAQGYKDIKERSAIARFKLKDDDAYMLAWTTTPWTLPSNTCLCVNPTEDYVRVKNEEYTYIMAEALVGEVLGEDVQIVDRFKGKDLEYKEYEPLFDLGKPSGKSFIIICDEYVTLTDGTGVVHIAPAFGEIDAKVAEKYGVGMLKFVDDHGNMSEETPWAGMFVKDADLEVLKELDKKGLLFSAPYFTHSYPHCWRCDTPLIYYARESWFIRMTEIKDDMIRNNNTINWIPPSIGKGRFGDWLENLQDWGISRDRYWGTPLNIWICEECGHMHSIGSRKELMEMSDNCPEDIELHRPFIDAVTIKCPKCGKTMRRTPEVIDCWFDSGAMPFAQYHYPFENKELFEKQFPAAFISEAVDQTRGWFYSLLAVSTLIFNKSSYENVIVLGHVMDADGQKMSKSKGNTVDPFDALAEYGADAIRWYFYSNSAPWLPNRFNGRAVVEAQRKVMGTLWNTYAFYILYADIDKFDPSKYKLEYDKLSVMDRWLLSRLASATSEVDQNLDKYRIPEAARAVADFVDDMSNWYVRRCRERFWAKGLEQDKINAYMTLYTALDYICRASAPMIPFITESIYQNLVRSVYPDAMESIHMCDFPKAPEQWYDKELDENMGNLLKVVAMGRACRNAANIKNRQPLQKMYVKADFALDEYYKTILLEELNIKEVEFMDEMEKFISYSFKPQLKTVGPKFGKNVGQIRELLSKIDGAKAMDELKDSGLLKLTLSDGSVAELTQDDLLVETNQMEGFAVVQEGQLCVALDVRLSDGLIEEGYVREIVSKLQTMRKDAGFEVMDRIKIYAAGNEKIQGVIEKNKTSILADVLADDVVFGSTSGYTKEWNINDENVTLAVEK